MTLLFTGTTPVWLLAILFIGASAFTVWAYQHPQLRKPWNWILPGCRILAIGLLILMLFQPVLGRVHETTVRGRIPVIVDTSGSMSITDRFEIDKQVDIAWNFELFPRELRTTAFIDQEEAAAEIDALLHQMSTPDAGLSNEPVADWVKIVKQADKQVREFKTTVNASVEKSTYLSYNAEEGRPGQGKGLTYERFDGISGSVLKNLTENKKFPQSPDHTSTISSFSVPENIGDNYGVRVRGYLRVPKTGEYVLKIAADDAAQLYLSDGTKAADKKLIAEVKSHTGKNSFTQASQKSAKIMLERKRAYYIEALLKEGSGEDYMMVAWDRPGQKPGTRSIPAYHLIPYVSGQEINRFDIELAGLGESIDNTLSGLEAVNAILNDIKDEPDAGVKRRLWQAMTNSQESWRRTVAQLPGLQSEADKLLAAAGLPEVNNALAEISKLSREEWTNRLLSDDQVALIAQLQEKGDVDLFSFSEPVAALDATQLQTQHSTLPATRIGSVLHQVLAQYEETPVAGAVLLTDGNANAGKPLAELRKTLEERSIPLYTIGIGSTLPPQDIVIERVVAPETSFKDDSINVSVVLRRPGYENRDIKVRLLREAEVVSEVTVPADGKTGAVASLSLVEDEVGVQNYTVIAMPLEDEVLNTNNSKEFSVNVLEDPINVLFIDEFPRWESRYASLILSRDPRVKLDAVFVDVLSTQPAQIREPILPPDREGLFAYDILVLGDVDPHHFSAEQLQNLSDFVVERGGTLVALAGEHHMPNAYRPTPLNNILPFRDSQLPGSAQMDDRGAVNISLELRDTFSQDSLVQIGTTPEESQLLWKRLPGMIWAKSNIAPATAADELVSTTPQNWPIMLTANPGSGKILYLGSDSFWRWRYRAKWTYHQRFWGQILLWAIRGRTAGSDPHVKLMSDRPAYSPGEPITLKARVFDKESRPLSNGSVAAEVRDADGKLVRNVPFVYLEDSGGEYRAQIRDLERGKYTVTPHVTELNDIEIDASWNVEVRDLPTSEYVHLSLNEPELKLMSDEYFAFHRAGGVAAAIKPVEIREEHRADLEIWDTFWMLALITLLLGFEWQMRKRNKLV